MGFAPAAAIGAKIGAPDKPVICLVGDGGFLSVSARWRRRWSWASRSSGWSSTTSASRRSGPSARPTSRTPTARSSRRRTASPTTRISCMLAKAFGIEAARVQTPDDLPAALTAAIAAERAVPPRSPHARRRADAAHRLLGHRRLPRAWQRLNGPPWSRGDRRSPQADGEQLRIRGEAVTGLMQHASFCDVVGLLLKGRLPDAGERRPDRCDPDRDRRSRGGRAIGGGGPHRGDGESPGAGSGDGGGHSRDRRRARRRGARMFLDASRIARARATADR